MGVKGSVVVAAGALVLVSLLLVPAAAGSTSGLCGANRGGVAVAVLGQTGSAAQAWALHKRAVAVGFRSSVIVEDSPGHYALALFGFPSLSAAASVRSEAARAGFKATARQNLISCKDTGADWEAVFGETSSRATAARLLTKIRHAGFTGGADVERDANGYYEVVLDRIGTTKVFPSLEREAYRAGWVVAIEPS